MNRHVTNRLALMLVSCSALVLLGLQAMAQEDDVVPKSEVNTVYPGKPYSPYADRAFPGMVLFGDTHSHTSVSADAAGGGTNWARATPIASRAGSR